MITGHAPRLDSAGGGSCRVDEANSGLGPTPLQHGLASASVKVDERAAFINHVSLSIAGLFEAALRCVFCQCKVLAGRSICDCLEPYLVLARGELPRE